MHPFEAREREEGQGMVEYAFILLLVALAAVVVLGVMGTTVADFFQLFVDRMQEAVGSS